MRYILLFDRLINQSDGTSSRQLGTCTDLDAINQSTAVSKEGPHKGFACRNLMSAAALTYTCMTSPSLPCRFLNAANYLPIGRHLNKTADDAAAFTHASECCKKCQG